MTTQYTLNFGLSLPDFRSGPWHDLINEDLKKIDALLLGAMAQGNVDAWANNIHYTVGVSVMDPSDASVWMCAKDHTSALSGTFAQDRTAHPTYWTRLLTGFAPRGQWQKNTQYFPYDLAYDTGYGIMALCITKHISTNTGTIIDDKVYWAFLLDMSNVGTVMASAVAYSNATSGLTSTNLQASTDELQREIVTMNNVNITQGNRLTSLESSDVSLDARLDAIELKTTTSYSAPFFTATQNVSVQFGGSAASGIYSGADYFAIRATARAQEWVYLQGVNGNNTYASFGPPGGSITGYWNVTGTMISKDVVAESVSATKAIYNSGWNGPYTSLMFLNKPQTAYMYFDGGSISFAGVSVISAGNGRLWGANDTLPGSAQMTGMRIGNSAYDYQFGTSGMVEPGPGLIVTGNGFTVGIGYQFRCRYLQYEYNGSWYTVAYG